MVAPAVVQAAAAVTGGGASYGGGGGGGGGEYDEGGGGSYEDGGGDEGGPGFDDESTSYGADTGQSDDEVNEFEGLGEINYEHALAGLGDWSSDLKSFGLSAGKAVASQALSTVAQKLGGSKAYTPPAPPPMSTATKVAIGAAVALPIGYLLLRRRPAT